MEKGNPHKGKGIIMGDLNVSSLSAINSYTANTPPGQNNRQVDSQGNSAESAKAALTTLQQNMAGALTNPSSPIVTDVAHLSNRPVEAVAAVKAAGDMISAEKTRKEEESEDRAAAYRKDGDDGSAPQENIIYSYSTSKHMIETAPQPGSLFSAKA